MKIISKIHFQIDICAEEFHNSVAASVAIQSDIQPAAEMLTKALKRRSFCLSKNDAWWKELNAKGLKNKEIVNVNYSAFLCN